MNLAPGLEARFLSLGFSAAEATVYLALLSSGAANGSRLASSCGLARTTAYAALESLLRRGAVLQTLGEPRTFRARPPGELFDELAARAAEDAAALTQALAAMEPAADQGEVWNVGDEPALLSKLGALIAGARREILLNTDHFMAALGPGLQAAAARGVRVIHFAYAAGTAAWPGVLTQRRYGAREDDCRGAREHHRLMMVVDLGHCVVAKRDPSGRVSGISTADKLLVRIMAEHIHHDIYLSRAAERQGQEIVQAGMELGSLLEAEA